MRRIDRLAGIPLCFLVSLALRALGSFARPAPPKPARVLFIELTEMGSTILADPAMRKLRAVTGAELFFVIFARNRQSLELTGTVPAANVFVIGDDGFFRLTADTVRFLLWARRTGIDTVIDLELFSRFTSLLTALCGAARRVGFFAFHNEGLYRGAMLTHRVAYNPHLHIAKNFIALVNALTAASPELPYSKSRIDDDDIRVAQAAPTESERRAVLDAVRAASPGFDRATQRLILINPNASEMLPQRRWPPEQFAALASALLARHPDALVLVTGARRERAEADLLVRRVASPRCVTFAGSIEVRQLPALYAQAALMVTNDSGPAHFAAVTALPTIVLFGPETPRLYGPLGVNAVALHAGLACSPCVSAANHRKTPCQDAVCMTAIPVEDVLAAAERALG